MTSKPADDPRSFGRRVLEYVAAGLAVIAVLFLITFFEIRTGIKITGGEIGFVGFTPFVFFFVLKAERHLWRQPRFWVATVGLLVLHVAVFIAVLRKYPELRLFWFGPLSLVEIALFTAALTALFDEDDRHHV